MPGFLFAFLQMEKMYISDEQRGKEKYKAFAEEMEVFMHTIAIITCYIGSLPEWFQLWLNSCVHNETIDFFVYTDQDSGIYQLPDNVRLRNTSLPALQRRISTVCGFEVSLEKAYKLCDYRPLYGLIFADDVGDYDFWAHCDIDLIFGNLRKFITEDILETYDRIFEVGHLSLYRNCKEVNEAWRLPGGMMPFKKVAAEKAYCGFDEHTGITRILRKNGFKTYSKVVCADIDPHYRAFYMMDEDSVSEMAEVFNYPHQIFTYEKGKVYQYYINNHQEVERQEKSYIHFMRRNPLRATDCLGHERIIITDCCFIPCKEEITEKTILKYDNYINGFCSKIEYIGKFIGNGIIACKRHQLWLRIKLRVGRIKLINKKYGGL